MLTIDLTYYFHLSLPTLKHSPCIYNGIQKKEITQFTESFGLGEDIATYHFRILDTQFVSLSPRNLSRVSDSWQQTEACIQKPFVRCKHLLPIWSPICSVRTTIHLFHKILLIQEWNCLAWNRHRKRIQTTHHYVYSILGNWKFCLILQ